MSELERLKSLLLTKERARIEALEARTDDVRNVVNDLPLSLPGLLEQAQLVAEPGRLGRALAEPVADALGEAVERRRERIVDAMFPVIMPAIRRAIAEALRAFSADINRLLESSFTPRGIAWRIESWRSGIPYADIALRHSLRFRVDHLLLIQNESGLVLDRESAADLPMPDSDAIAGMLTAISDFVRDSVAGEGDDGLSSATVGEHLLWVLEGPHAKLAAFIRGVPPESLKNELRTRLEMLHGRFGEELNRTPDQLVGLPEVKDALTPNDLRSSQDLVNPAALQKGSMRVLWVLAAIALVLLAAMLFSSWRWQQRVSAAETRLRQWPGFHLDRLESTRWQSVHIIGLLDPLADSPLDSLKAQEFSGLDVRMDVRGYLSTDAPIAAKRLRSLLALPDSVKIESQGENLKLVGFAGLEVRDRLRAEWAPLLGVAALDVSELRWDLVAAVRQRIGLPDSASIQATHEGWAISGTAGHDWQMSLKTLLAEQPLFGAVDWSKFSLQDPMSLELLNQQLQQLLVRFRFGTERQDEAPAAIDQIADLITRAHQISMQRKQKLVVEVIGLNDESGSAARNAALRGERSEFLERELRQRLAFEPEFRRPAESNPLIATIRSRAALAQLRFE